MTLTLDQLDPNAVYRNALGLRCVVVFSGGSQTGMRPVRGQRAIGAVDSDTVRVALMVDGVLPDLQVAEFHWARLDELERIATLTDVNTDPTWTDARVRNGDHVLTAQIINNGPENSDFITVAVTVPGKGELRIAVFDRADEHARDEAIPDQVCVVVVPSDEWPTLKDGQPVLQIVLHDGTVYDKEQQNGKVH